MHDRFHPAPHHRDRHRGGPFGRGFRGHGPHHGRHGRGGPRARRGDVRLAILQLIAEEPTNGYGLIVRIAERTDDRWQPSPGSIYPVLQMLVEEGLADREPGEQGRYSITAAGLEHLEHHREQADRVWDNGRGPTEAEEQLQDSLHKLMGATRELAVSGNGPQQERASALIDEVRKQIYGILSE